MLTQEEYLIDAKASIKDALEKLNRLQQNFTLFVLDNNRKVLGSVTDGDVRRWLIKSGELNTTVDQIMNKNFRYINKFNYTIEHIDEIRQIGITLIPIVDEEGKLVRLVDLSEKISLLPLDAVIMAGGEGKRLRPLTNNLPKPLLPIGSKPIIEHNVDRLCDYGIENIHISLNYLGHLIQDHFKDGQEKNIRIQYVNEDSPLGTIGAISKINNFHHKDILIMNSDLLTNINFEDFYKEFVNKGADMAVASIPYIVSVPYAVLETDDDRIVSFKEKPTYTYYSSAGIYLIKREVINHIPHNQFFNATDLIDALIAQNKKVIYFPLLGYWLDIGRHEDYTKAQEDIKHIKL